MFLQDHQHVVQPDVTMRHPISRGFEAPYPDLIPHHHPEDQLSHGPNFNDISEKFNVGERTRQRRSVSTSSDYFSYDGGSLCGDDSLSESEFLDDTNDEVDDCKSGMSSQKQNKELVYRGVDWAKLGSQLCEIASAFEVTYSPLQNDHQRELYRVYTQLKLRTLVNSRRDESAIGLAKTVCRQVLLSTIWILLKKIL